MDQRIKDFTLNIRPQEVKMTNKVLREKLNCVVCQSSKSRFQNKKHNKKKKNFFTSHKTLKFIVEAVKNTKVRHFQKT